MRLPWSKRHTAPAGPTIDPPDNHDEPVTLFPAVDPYEDQGDTMQPTAQADDKPTTDADTFVTDDRPACDHCRGTGRQLTTNDILREITGLLPTDNGQAMDGIVAEFYRRLLTGDGASLAELFPPDLVTAAYGTTGSGGMEQRDRLLRALVDVFKKYDPDHPQSEGMVALETKLLAWGYRHASFQRSDGTGDGARPKEYRAVIDIAVGLFEEGLAERWRPEYGPALQSALEHAETVMRWGAWLFRKEHNNQVFARLARHDAMQGEHP